MTEAFIHPESDGLVLTAWHSVMKPKVLSLLKGVEGFKESAMSAMGTERGVGNTSATLLPNPKIVHVSSSER